MQGEADEPDTDELERQFRHAMQLPAGLEPHLRAALGHVLQHAGSMVRPRVVYQVARAYGVQERTAMELGVALEYFHTASLIFDDLPAMDNASSRRGALYLVMTFSDRTPRQRIGAIDQRQGGKHRA